MTLQTSGAISLSQVQSEYGGSNPISMSEYYRNGSHVNAYGAYQYSTSNPIYQWLTINSTNGVVTWNNSAVANGLGNSSSTTASNFTYQRGTLQSTVNIKGTEFRYYNVRRKYAGTANNNVPTSGSISMNDFYGGVSGD